MRPSCNAAGAGASRTRPQRRRGLLIASCTAPAATLRARVSLRERAARDASEAGLAVLETSSPPRSRSPRTKARHALVIDANAAPARRKRRPWRSACGWNH